MLIESTQNAKIKNLRALYRDKRAREEQGVYIAEGVNLVKDAPRVKNLFIKKSKEEELRFLNDKFGVEAFIVKDEIFDAVADTKTPSGVIALVEKPNEKVRVTGEIVLLLDGISDCGNLGTIIRTAAARGIETVVCADCADAYAPKCVRSAMSGTFFVNIIETDRNGALTLLDGYGIIGLDMGGTDVFAYKRTGKTAIAVGSEAKGLSKEIREKAKDIVAIPMSGKIESLNAAISVGIAMYVIQ